MHVCQICIICTQAGPMAGDDVEQGTKTSQEKQAMLTKLRLKQWDHQALRLQLWPKAGPATLAGQVQSRQNAPA